MYNGGKWTQKMKSAFSLIFVGFQIVNRKSRLEKKKQIGYLILFPNVMGFQKG